MTNYEIPNELRDFAERSVELLLGIGGHLAPLVRQTGVVERRWEGVVRRRRLRGQLAAGGGKDYSER